MEADQSQGFILHTLTPRTQHFIDDCIQHGLRIPYEEGSLPRTFYLTQRLVQLFQNASRLYLPLHFVIFMIRVRRQGGNNASQLAVRTLKGLVYSSLFTAVYAMSIPGSYCYLDKLCGRPKSTNIGFIISSLFSCAIFLESKSRWNEISLYVLSQWLEGFVFSLKKRKIIPRDMNWQVDFSHPSEE